MSCRFDRTAGPRWIVWGALALLCGPAYAQQTAPETPAKPDTAPAGTTQTSPQTPAVTAPPAQPDRPGQLPEDGQAIPTTTPAANSWRYIVIHHSASPSGNSAVFDRMHRAKGWDGVAYHFVITNGHGGPDGGLEVSRRWWVQKHGAHAGALPVLESPDDRNCYNEFGIGVCLVGNFEKQAPTHRQLVTLAKLIGKLQAKYHIPPDQILGHGHVKSTACPGSHFPWQSLFTMAHLPAPTHLYRHYASGTLERCPWCRAKGYVPATRLARHTAVKPGEPSVHDLDPAKVDASTSAASAKGDAAAPTTTAAPTEPAPSDGTAAGTK